MAETTTGILKCVGKQQFVIRTADRSYRPGLTEVMVCPNHIRRFALTEGAAVTGCFERKKGKARLVSIESVSGVRPEDFRKRPHFADMVAVDPHERFHLSDGGQESMRIIDLIAPIGKGTRQLIASPPKAGKTVLLEHIVHAIHQCSPDSRIIVLLVDERPEEVTHFRRAVEGAEVVASASSPS
jgi:transcription termination factor Rho